MHEVDKVIGQRLTSSVPLVAQISQYIIAAGGKRLRPALLLMVCGALGYRGALQHSLAAVVELIHTATLLHDDVVDASTLRRGRPTANETFGNPASVLVGDFLHTRSFQMMVEAGSMRIMEILSEATNVIAEGEVLQLMNMHDASLDEAGYLRVIRSKTAKLFEASARLGAILANSPPDVEEACATYGQALGTAFQIIDDDKLASRIKVISRLDISEKRVPQDGRMKLKVGPDRVIDFRVSTLPTLFGEKIVIRILDPSSAKLGIDALGYEPPGVNIATAEDPSEINLPGVNQVNVNEKAGLTFAVALKSFLRQDPDIIMVGEIRDLETADISIKAAQTGHLIAEQARAEGVRSLRESGLYKAKLGLTSLEEVLAVTNE
eukprot:gene2244-2198_t